MLRCKLGLYSQQISALLQYMQLLPILVMKVKAVSNVVTYGNLYRMCMRLMVIKLFAVIDHPLLPHSG